MSSSAQSASHTEMLALAGDHTPFVPAQQAAERFPWVKCDVTLDLPVVRFTIRDLLELRTGNILETSCKATSDVPLRVNGTLIGWTEFEVIGNTLAVRITELA